MSTSRLTPFSSPSPAPPIAPLQSSPSRSPIPSATAPPSHPPPPRSPTAGWPDGTTPYVYFWFTHAYHAKHLTIILIVSARSSSSSSPTEVYFCSLLSTAPSDSLLAAATPFLLARRLSHISPSRSSLTCVLPRSHGHNTHILRVTFLPSPSLALAAPRKYYHRIQTRYSSLLMSPIFSPLPSSSHYFSPSPPSLPPSLSLSLSLSSYISASPSPPLLLCPPLLHLSAFARSITYSRAPPC